MDNDNNNNNNNDNNNINSINNIKNNNNNDNNNNKNTENVAYENRSDPCGCWCAWYSVEGYDRKRQESIRESCYDRDSKDLHAGICANPQKAAQCMNRMIDLTD